VEFVGIAPTQVQWPQFAKPAGFPARKNRVLRNLVSHLLITKRATFCLKNLGEILARFARFPKPWCARAGRLEAGATLDMPGEADKHGVTDTRHAERVTEDGRSTHGVAWRHGLHFLITNRAPF
jgi:hypothetical protein